MSMPADVVPFDEIRRSSDRLAFADGVLIDLGGDGLQRREVLDLLHADDVWRAAARDGLPATPCSTGFERGRCQRDVADAGSFDGSKNRSMLNDAIVNCPTE